jgi:hypothetical protein
VLENSCIALIFILVENVCEFFVFDRVWNDAAGKDFQVYFCLFYAGRSGQFGVSSFRQRCEYFVVCNGYLVLILFLIDFTELAKTSDYVQKRAPLLSTFLCTWN